MYVHRPFFILFNSDFCSLSTSIPFRYIFPGLGLGAILAKAEHVSDDMVYQTAATLAEALDDEERSHELLYPHLTRIREVSALVARDVVKAALKEVSLSCASPPCTSSSWRTGHSDVGYLVG